MITGMDINILHPFKTINMKYFLILLTLWVPTVGYSLAPHIEKITGTYSFGFPNPQERNLYCNIQISNSGEYMIDLTKIMTEDIVHGALVSYGNYIIRNDTIVMRDTILDYSLKAIEQSGNLQFITGFSYLLNRKIPKTHSTSYIDINFYCQYPFYNHHTLINKLSQISCNTFGYPNIHPGSYYSTDYFLRLNEDHSYCWNIMDLTISSGTWSQQGYVLTLVDTTLNQLFYAIVSMGELYSMLLPGEYEGINLTKRN